MEKLSVTILIFLFVFTLQAEVSSKECWGKWINNVHPKDEKNRTDREVRPKDDKDIGCNTTILKTAQCMDDKGEPFDKSKNGSNYFATCDYSNGLKCTPASDFKVNNYTCPDFSIQFGCKCPANVSSATGSPVGSSGRPGSGTGVTNSNSTSSGTGTNSGKAKSSKGGNNGGTSDYRLSFGGILHIVVLTVMTICFK